MNGTRDEARERARQFLELRGRRFYAKAWADTLADFAESERAAGERAGLELAAQRCEKEQSSVGDAYAKAIRALAVEGEQK